MFQSVLRGSPLDIVIDGGKSAHIIVRMKGGFPQGEAVPKLVVFIADHAFPARRKIDLVGYHVPIPKTVVRTFYRQRVSFATGPQLLFTSYALGDVLDLRDQVQ